MEDKMNRRNILKCFSLSPLCLFGSNVNAKAIIPSDNEVFRFVSESGLTIIYRNKYGQLHNEDGPAVLQYAYFYDTLFLSKERYFENDKQHRIGGPSTIGYFPDGKVYSKHFYEHGKSSKTNPTSVFYKRTKNGSVYKFSEQWWDSYSIFDQWKGQVKVNTGSKRHRENGPALTEYDELGNIINKEFWENGVRQHKTPQFNSTPPFTGWRIPTKGDVLK